jgi:hypothetical protein
VQVLERACVFLRRDVKRRHSVAVGPERDRELAVRVDARMDPRIEGRHSGADRSKAPSDFNLELGGVVPIPKRNASEDIARLKIYRDPVRVVYDDRVIDAQIACSGYRLGRSNRSQRRRGIHGGYSAIGAKWATSGNGS